MGIRIRIGEWAEVYGRAPFVSEAESSDAPGGDDFGPGRANFYDVSYCGWAAFCRATGLTRMFSDKTNGLLRRHPGIVRIDQDHAVELRSAIDRYMKKHPGARLEDEAHFDLALLRWLLFWFEWSLARCKVPAIENG